MSARDDYPELAEEARWFGFVAAALDEIDRLREQTRSFANEIVQMHHDRDVYDTALEDQLNEARDGLDERDRIIIERDNEIAQLRAAGGTVPADPPDEIVKPSSEVLCQPGSVPPEISGVCDVTACESLATFCIVGESGDLWLCNEHAQPNQPPADPPETQP